MTGTTADSAAPVWIRGPAWDGVWMLSALWLAPLALWLASGYADPESSPLDLLCFGLTALFWIGHRLSSVWLAYCTEAYRPVRRAQPVRFVVIPALVTVGCFAVFLPSDAALPWPRGQRIVALAILDYAFVTYHFAAQHFGVLSLYRTRIGRGACLLTRRLDRLFALGVGGVLVFLANMLSGAVAYQALWADRLMPAAWLASAEAEMRQWGLLILLVVTAAVLFMEVRAPKVSLPRVLYVLGLAAMVAVALRPGSVFLFFVIWNAQHWMLAIALSSQTPQGEENPKRGVVRQAFHRCNQRPWAVLLLLMGTSVLLLPFFEVEANWQGGPYYGDWIFGAVAAGLRTTAWVSTLLALGFATGFVHYLLDRAVYRFSDPQVRAAARGLLVKRKESVIP